MLAMAVSSLESGIPQPFLISSRYYTLSVSSSSVFSEPSRGKYRYLFRNQCSSCILSTLRSYESLYLSLFTEEVSLIRAKSSFFFL